MNSLIWHIFICLMLFFLLKALKSLLGSLLLNLSRIFFCMYFEDVWFLEKALNGFLKKIKKK